MDTKSSPVRLNEVNSLTRQSDKSDWSLSGANPALGPLPQACDTRLCENKAIASHILNSSTISTTTYINQPSIMRFYITLTILFSLMHSLDMYNDARKSIQSPGRLGFASSDIEPHVFVVGKDVSPAKETKLTSFVRIYVHKLVRLLHSNPLMCQH